MIEVEYRVKRTIQTNCCSKVYYVWETEAVDVETESEAINYIYDKHSPSDARIKE